MKRRSRNLNDSDIRRIAEEIATWQGKLSWELLVKHLIKIGMPEYTRQALYKHERIRLTFTNRKEQLAQEPEKNRKPVSPQLAHAYQRIERLEQLKADLEHTIDRLYEQFDRWVYNAAGANISVERLNQSLPKINRSSDIVEIKPKKPVKAIAVIKRKPLSGNNRENGQGYGEK
jgi:hypothetical protein